MRVEVRGKTYETVAEASKALNIRKSTIYNAICKGRTDGLGMGKGNHRNKRGGTSKPFSIGGMTFASRREASLKLGFNFYYISSAYSTKRKSALEKIAMAAMELSARNERKAMKEAQREAA